MVLKKDLRGRLRSQAVAEDSPAIAPVVPPAAGEPSSGVLEALQLLIRQSQAADERMACLQRQVTGMAFLLRDHGILAEAGRPSPAPRTPPTPLLAARPIPAPRTPQVSPSGGVPISVAASPGGLANPRDPERAFRAFSKARCVAAPTGVVTPAANFPSLSGNAPQRPASASSRAARAPASFAPPQQKQTSTGRAPSRRSYAEAVSRGSPPVPAAAKLVVARTAAPISRSLRTPSRPTARHQIRVGTFDGLSNWVEKTLAQLKKEILTGIRAELFASSSRSRGDARRSPPQGRRCSYCKKNGHEFQNCWTRAHNNSCRQSGTTTTGSTNWRQAPPKGRMDCGCCSLCEKGLFV
ncbi:translation initiation factor IF-2-like isoform X2 [Athalia rosae]|uniref:translation initiation factor IF-2-like isoform X2 n=1 Tax=Athalia rosae TaxID=37344 RepID=UPI0020344424|nr:translation initiation factor IF-2-like isoform X2 [Athalia rosae]